MNKLIKHIICYSLIGYSQLVSAKNYPAIESSSLPIKISKGGLNRISNPPYKIVQVTGDDSQFRLKYDEDGSNIYFMPLTKIGENIEISVKNNAGMVQDLELQVSNIKGQSIIIDAKKSYISASAEKLDIAEMLRAMQDDIAGKFYVQSCRHRLGNSGPLKVTQKKIYKYKNLIGAVFEITNPKRQEENFNISEFIARFDNVKSSFANNNIINPRQSINVLVVQKLLEK